MLVKPKVLLIMTLDTKELEAGYVTKCLEESGIDVYLLDASIRKTIDGGAEITPDQIAAAAGMTIAEVRALNHEGKCQAVMIEGAIKCAHGLHDRIGLSGILGVGGSMGTALATAIMRDFPFGLPKVMVSTMASGMTKGYVGTKDIVMVNSVCDIAGLNTVTRSVFRNGALAVAGMAHGYKSKISPDMPQVTNLHLDKKYRELLVDAQKPLIAISTLGTTDKCTIRIRSALEEKGFEVMVFHTLGTGGMIMDEVVWEQDVLVAIDLSLVEVNDFLHQGLCSAGPDRCKAALKKGVPTIFAPGNIDFMVAGPLDDAQARVPGKRYHIHNVALTAVRSEAEEFRHMAEHMAELIKEAKGPVTFFVPLLGFSAHDSEQGHLHDPSLPPVFAEHLKKFMPAGVPVKEFPFHINDEQFADAIIEQVLAFLPQSAA
jgi:uncharacterized protein (UPF0261 family)